jgi:hypothetical protein
MLGSEIVTVGRGNFRVYSNRYGTIVNPFYDKEFSVYV